MADLSDVENAIVSKISDALYPLGISQPSTVGVTCRVYRGWPTSAALNSDLTAGVVNVTVLPATKPDEVLDPYFDQLEAKTSPTGMAAVVVGQGVTFSGSIVGNL